MKPAVRLWLMLALWITAVGCHGNAASAPAPAAPKATAAAATAGPTAAVYMCPMDKDIRKLAPGKCPRCGMALVTSVPDPVEYHVAVSTTDPPVPMQVAHLTFHVTDPWKNNPVTHFSLVHERLYHAFVVSSDLEFFSHGHPEWKDGAFQYDVTFPKPGMYRVLSDFYPEASAPQLVASTVFVGGDVTLRRPKLARDYSDKQDQNFGARLVTIPEMPVAGMPTRLRFTVGPIDGFEKYLGVWAHMLAASDDLIDMMHTHPMIANGGAEVEFNVVFPRARGYRVWVQFQRKGVVNTMRFDVPVQSLPDAPVGAIAVTASPAHGRG
jgi:heavy metal-binding protein